MNFYNGFSPHQRVKALAWLKTQMAAGVKPPRPTVCDACGQDGGVLEWHSEDYSEPFGLNIGAHGLCYVCHMMVHCRFRNAARWHEYVDAVRDGGRFAPVPGRNFPLFRVCYLQPLQLSEPDQTREPPAVCLLDRIESGELRPRTTETAFDEAAFEALR